VKTYLAALRQFDPVQQEKALIILQDDARWRELDSTSAITLGVVDAKRAVSSAKIAVELTYSPAMKADIEKRWLQRAVDESFNDLVLQPKIVALTLASFKPTFELDERATVEAQNRAADVIVQNEVQVEYRKN